MKKGVMNKTISSLLFALVLLPFAGALGISPAITEINFAPNEVHTIEIYIYNGKRMIEVYPEGPLAPYVSLDKSNLDMAGKVIATINMPSKIETPGRNILYITAAETAPQDQFVGTSVRVKSTIAIHVPFPGKYIDLALSVPNVNVGERIPVELKVINRGTDNLTVDSTINIRRRDGTLIESATIEFDPVEIYSPGEYNFRRYLDSSKLGPSGLGDYIAEANIDYSGLKRQINTSFKVGSLDINVTNFTREIELENVNKFFIDVRSDWNGKIEEVYADVKIYNGNYSLVFRTPPIDIGAWEEKRIVGYFDGGGLENGEYDVEIRLNYEGRVSYTSGKLNVRGAGKINNWILIAGAVIGLIVLAVALRSILKKLLRKKGIK